MWIWRGGKKVWESPPAAQHNSAELAAKYVPAIRAMLKGAPKAPVALEAVKEAEFRAAVEDVFPGGEWKDDVIVDDPDLE